MSTWQLNKSYRLVDVNGFVKRLPNNHKIFDKIHENTFKVTKLDYEGFVLEIELVDKILSCSELGLLILFNRSEYNMFEEVTTETEFNRIPVYSNPVAEWLVKLNFILQNDKLVYGIHHDKVFNKLYIATEFGDIHGTIPEIVEFVENKHTDLLKYKEAKEELVQKRLELLDELSKIDQELNRYGE